MHRAGARVRALNVAWPLVGLWLASAAGLSLVTTRVRDWYVMTDELRHERLAISIAHTHSPFPHIHGELVRVFELYPLLIAPLFGSGLVEHDLARVHFLNAWLITSACIPAFLLARRVSGSRLAAYFVAAFSVLLPWSLYASFLLTEVVAYPAFAWALLAIQRTTVAPSKRKDLLALAAVVVAFLARTELLVLALVLPLTLLSVERRNVVRAHPVATIVSAAAALSAVGFFVAGGSLADLTVYGQLTQGGALPPGTPTSYLKHDAIIGLGLGILPLVVGAGWLLANALRRPSGRELGVFAWLGTLVVLLLPLEATSYDLQIGVGAALDRFLFYLAPLVAIAFSCALLDSRRPRWSLALPVAVVVAGFALGPEPAYTWNDAYGRIDADAPVSALFRPLVSTLHGVTATRAALAGATTLLAALFLAGAARLRPRLLTAVAGTLVLVFLAGETVYLFNRLLTADGVASRPLTVSPAAQFDWVDRTVGTGADVTLIPAPIGENYFQTQQYWRDLEFWNVSVDRDVHLGSPDRFDFTGLWFPKQLLRFDPRTGLADRSPTPYAVEALKEDRFRLAGTVVASTPQALLIHAKRPWRADWITFGLYDDGWTKPETPARVRVFAQPGQKQPILRYLTFQIWAPDGVASRPFTVRSNLQVRRGVAGGATAFVNGLRVCVPAHGFTDVALDVSGSSTIPGDLATLSESESSRQGGVFLAQIALADDLGGACRPRG